MPPLSIIAYNRTSDVGGFVQMSAIRQIVYISQATHAFAQAELDELVKVSQDNNKKYGITGAMLYLENSFIQVIEGEDSVVAQLLKNLYADSRHRDIRIVSDSVVPARNFQNWSMGIVQPPQEERTRVRDELGAASAIDVRTEEQTTAMPISQTFMMLRRLYDTSNVLHRAKSNLSL